MCTYLISTAAARAGGCTAPSQAAGILLTAVLLVLTAAPNRSSAEPRDDALTPPTPLDVKWCLARARHANPRIAYAVARADAAGSRATSAGTLEDPRLSYEASNVPIGDWDFNSTPLSGHQFGLQQKLPFPGMLGNQNRAARAGADAARLETEEDRRRVAGSVEATWTQLGFAQRSLEITDRNLAVLRQLTETATAGYRVGRGQQQDVFRAELELTGLLESRLRRVFDVESASASLAALLDLPHTVAMPVTAALEETTPLPPLDTLLRELDANSPMLRAQIAHIEEARRQQSATKFEGYPEFDLGVGYRLRRNVSGDPVNGDDFVGAGVTIRLPVNRGKWRAKLAERGAIVRQQEASLRAKRSSLQAHVRTRYAELVRADSEIVLLDSGLLPQARQSLESGRAGYEVGRGDFRAVLEGQTLLIQTELRHARAIADRRIAFAELEAAVGRTLR